MFVQHRFYDVGMAGGAQPSIWVRALCLGWNMPLVAFALDYGTARQRTAIISVTGGAFHSAVESGDQSGAPELAVPSVTIVSG